MIELDGRTGEGGGQLVRIAVAIAAVTGQALQISNVRGNRRGGGLKAQHVSAIEWLTTATGATVQGLSVGSSTLVFKPGPTGALTAGPDGYAVLRPATAAASTSLMLQAVLPYLVFRGGAEPLSVVLHGGTHVAWAPSFDYLDQVLFPTLEAWFGIRVDRTLESRGWNAGTANFKDAGRVRLVVHPAGGGKGLTPRLPTLQARTPISAVIPPATPAAIVAIDVTILAPTNMHGPLSEALVQALGDKDGDEAQTGVLDGADLHLRTVEDSGHGGRVYVLLVARTARDEDEDGRPVRRWGRDYLGMENIWKLLDGEAGHGKKKGKKGGKGGGSSRAGKGGSSGTENGGLPGLCGRIAGKVVRELAAEVEGGGCGDSFLQDQVVVFQALAAGRTSFWRGEKEEEVVAERLERLKLNDRNEQSENQKDQQEQSDRTRLPFGQGSLHAQTARWVTAQMLAVKWFAGGTECEGAAWTRGSVRAE